jgi:hypothetical protein
MRNGHPFHLYVYGSAGNVPDGVVLKDGNEVVPETDIGAFSHLAQFADWFRCNLLFKLGGVWVDMDTVCMRALDLPEPYLITEQHDRAGGFAVNNAYLKAPKGSKVMEWLINRCQAVRPEWKILPWEALGPALCLQATAKFSLPVRPAHEFNPIPWWNWDVLLKDSHTEFSLPPYAIHLWRAMWRSGLPHDPDRQYPRACLYERLKRRYLGA